jgi:hypothetical protein
MAVLAARFGCRRRIFEVERGVGEELPIKRAR